MCTCTHTCTHTHRVESISGRQLPSARERPRGSREAYSVPASEPPSWAAQSCAPAWVWASRNKGKTAVTVTPLAARQKEMGVCILLIDLLREWGSGWTREKSLEIKEGYLYGDGCRDAFFMQECYGNTCTERLAYGYMNHMNLHAFIPIGVLSAATWKLDRNIRPSDQFTHHVDASAHYRHEGQRWSTYL